MLYVYYATYVCFPFLTDNPEVPKQLKISQEIDGRLTVSWISGSNGGSKQSFYIQIRDASSSDWFEVQKKIKDDDMLQIHTDILPRLFASPMYIRMYSKSSYGQSAFTTEVYIPGQETDNGNNKQTLYLFKAGLIEEYLVANCVT